jgi:hypothetical protein
MPASPARTGLRQEDDASTGTRQVEAGGRLGNSYESTGFRPLTRPSRDIRQC